MASAAAQTAERIAEIRVHGNHTTPEADVLMLSGLEVGQGATADVLAAAATRLRETDRFSGAEVLKRFLSIADPTRILVMIVVDERPGVDELDLTPGPMKRIRAAGMWMPVLTYADGYGFTYGARVAFIDPLGPHTRIAVPLTWGGERRAGVELERTFERGPLSVVRGAGSIYRRVNPHYELPDQRTELRVRAERAIVPWLRAGAGARTARVEFDGLAARHDAVLADVTFDTRVDPSFPRNAVLASIGVERLAGEDMLRAATITTTDIRGYIGVFGSAVLALRAGAQTTATALPRSEQPLLGGSNTLRGYAAGTGAGDNLFTTSAELRVPVNSPLSVGRFGVKGFVDAGTTWNVGERLTDRVMERGIGGGIYFGAGPVVGDLAIAWPRVGSPRLHFGFGVTF